MNALKMVRGMFVGVIGLSLLGAAGSDGGARDGWSDGPARLGDVAGAEASGRLGDASDLEDTGEAGAPAGVVAALGDGCEKPRDLDGDGFVDAADLALLLSWFGTDFADADFNGDGMVSAADLAALLGAWGPAAPRSQFVTVWPLTEEGHEWLHGAFVTTDDVQDITRSDHTVPVVVDAPGGGKALRCRVFEANRHSEFHMPVESPEACDIYFAFDMYVDSASLPYGGDPFVNWIHWLRIGEGANDHMAAMYGHMLRPQGMVLRFHFGDTGPLLDHDVELAPFDQWVRMMVRWRVARDGAPGELVVYRDNVEYARQAHWKTECHRFRLRMRSVAPCDRGVIYFRNAAMGTNRAQVWAAMSP